MSRVIFAACVLIALGCGQRPVDEDVVASSRVGDVQAQEVERTLQTVPGIVESSDRDALMEAYRGAAESIVCERVLLPVEINLETTESELGEVFKKLHRGVVLDRFRRLELTALKTDREELEAYYRDHRAEFHRTAQRYLWHIFVRHEDPANPDRTVELLNGIRARFLEGESFDELAREHSQSETRLLGGRIGWVGRGRMPPAVDEVVFSMGKGEISEPLAVRGGAALLMVSEAVEERDLGFEDVAVLIAERLRREAAQDQVESILVDYQLPEDAYVIPSSSFLSLVAASGTDDPVIEVAGQRVTAGEFYELLEDRGHRMPGLPFLQDDPEMIYRALVADLKLYHHLITTGFDDRPEVREAIDVQLTQGVRAELYRRRMEAVIQEEVAGRDEELAAFFNNNRFLYQSPLRVKLRMLSVPIGSNVDAVAARVREARQALVDGHMTFDSAAERLGGETRDLGWMTSQQLERIEPKVKVYVLSLRSAGYSVPFQLNRRLNIIWVQEWEDPLPMEFEAVADRVREDYSARHQQEIYRDVVDRILDDVDFRFHEDNVRRALADPEKAEG